MARLALAMMALVMISAVTTQCGAAPSLTFGKEYFTNLGNTIMDSLQTASLKIAKEEAGNGTSHTYKEIVNGTNALNNGTDLLFDTSAYVIKSEMLGARNDTSAIIEGFRVISTAALLNIPNENTTTPNNNSSTTAAPTTDTPTTTRDPNSSAASTSSQALPNPMTLLGRK